MFSSLIKIKNQILIAILFCGASHRVYGENIFIQIGRESQQLESEFARGNLAAHNIRKISGGNKSLIKIPDYPSFTKLYARTILKGQFAALMAKNPTQFAVTLGKSRIPEIMSYLKSKGLLAEAVRVAKIFKIDVLHVLGPVIGEFTFNGSIDRYIQDKQIDMFTADDYEKMNFKMRNYINHPEIQSCMNAEIANYWKWRCVVAHSEATFNNSNADLVRQYYEISKHGTFGIGQVQPFLLWAYADIVQQKIKNYVEFELTDSQKFMAITRNEKKMLAYIAAMISTSIQIYRQVARVDISKNLGLTTTLYNIGDEYQHAYFFNERQIQEPEAEPQVNYMGWFVNYFEGDIRSYL
jgi:hypothetical protein